MKKTAPKPKEKKTSGTVIVEEYRPRMNKWTEAERERRLARPKVTL